MKYSIKNFGQDFPDDKTFDGIARAMAKQWGEL